MAVSNYRQTVIGSEIYEAGGGAWGSKKKFVPYVAQGGQWKKPTILWAAGRDANSNLVWKVAYCEGKAPSPITGIEFTAKLYHQTNKGGGVSPMADLNISDTTPRDYKVRLTNGTWVTIDAWYSAAGIDPNKVTVGYYVRCAVSWASAGHRGNIRAQVPFHVAVDTQYGTPNPTTWNDGTNRSRGMSYYGIGLHPGVYTTSVVAPQVDVRDVQPPDGIEYLKTPRLTFVKPGGPAHTMQITDLEAGGTITRTNNTLINDNTDWEYYSETDTTWVNYWQSRYPSTTTTSPARKFRFRLTQ